MCKCIKKLEEKLVGTQWKGKAIIKAEFQSAALMFSTGICQASGEAEVVVEGGKRPLKVPIVYSHCPFCGAKYETKSNMKQIS